MQRAQKGWRGNRSRGLEGKGMHRDSGKGWPALLRGAELQHLELLCSQSNEDPTRRGRTLLGWDFGDKPGAAQARLAEVGDSKGSPQAVCASGRAQQMCEGLNPP